MIRLFPNYYPRYNQVCTKETLNNAVLNSQNAMPLKNETTTDGADFSIDRHKYAKIYQTVPANNNNVTYTNADVGGHKDIMGQIVNTGRNVSQSNTVKSNLKDLQKKWYGNRDASQIVANRRVQSVGKGTFNALNTPQQFVTKNNNNVTYHGKRKFRAGGAKVPPIVGHKYKNSPIFY
jgi:hypothetical protein